MERISRMCDEIHVFAGSAERTGNVVELRGMKARNRTCTCVTDLVRKYKLYGDGLFYLPIGKWPQDATQIELDNVKWIGIARAFEDDRDRNRD